MIQNGGPLLPFYVVIDVSAGAAAGGKLEAAGAIMPAIVEALARNPALSSKIRFGLIDFAGTASVRLPLCDVLDGAVRIPALVPGIGAGYAAVFTLLAREIGADVARLKTEGFVVHRPVVWFISDGTPDDDPVARQAAFDQLVTGKTYPNLIPCGVGTARPDILGALVHPATGPKKAALYMTGPNEQPAKAFAAIAEVIISSAIQSGYGLGHGNTRAVLPGGADLPAGIAQVDPDDVV